MPSPSLNFLGVPVTIPLEDMGEAAVVEASPPDGPTADVWFKCPWADRYTVVKYLRGGVVRAGTRTVYLRPASYPDSPNLLCTSIPTIHGRKPRVLQAGSALPGWVTYQYAYLQAHFSVPTWDAIGQTPQDASGIPMTTTRFRASAEIFAPPSGSYYYAAGAYNTKPVAESSVGIVRSRVEISMTRHLIPYPYLNGIMSYDGTVNAETITFGDMTFPRGTLLFAGADTDQTSDPSTGDRCWDYTFTFLGNETIEWNEYMAPDGLYVLINSKSDGTGDAPFEYISYADLFGDTF